MPRLNLPQNQVRSAGSTGVQPDIHTGSPQFAAINRLASSIEGYADEKRDSAIRMQNHVDNGATQFYKRNSIEFEMALDGKMQENRDHRVQKDLANQEFKAYRETIREELDRRGVSDSMKAEAFESLDHFEKNYRTKMEHRHIGENIELANMDIQANALAVLESGRDGAREEALAAIDQMQGISEAAKRVAFDRTVKEASDNLFNSYMLELAGVNNQEHGSTLQARIENDPILADNKKKTALIAVTNKAKSLLSAYEKGIEDFVLNDIESSTGLTDLGSITVSEESEGTATYAGERISVGLHRKINRAYSRKKDQLSLRAASVTSALARASRNGDTTELEIESADIPTAHKVAMKAALNASSRGVGYDDISFKELAADVKDWAFSGDSNFLTGFTSEPDIGKKEELWKSITEGNFNMDAKLRLTQLMVEAERMDYANGEIDVASTPWDKNYSEVQTQAVASASEMLSKALGGVPNTKYLPATSGGKLFAGVSEADRRRSGAATALLSPDIAFDTWLNIRSIIDNATEADTVDGLVEKIDAEMTRAKSRSLLNDLMRFQIEAAKTKGRR